MLGVFATALFPIAEILEVTKCQAMIGWRNYDEFLWPLKISTCGNIHKKKRILSWKQLCRTAFWFQFYKSTYVTGKDENEIYSDAELFSPGNILFIFSPSPTASNPSARSYQPDFQHTHPESCLLPSVPTTLSQSELLSSFILTNGKVLIGLPPALLFLLSSDSISMRQLGSSISNGNQRALAPAWIPPGPSHQASNKTTESSPAMATLGADLFSTHPHFC